MQDIHQMQLSLKDILFDIKINGHFEIFVDEEMIKIVLRNLIHNALKFCSAKDTIILSAEIDEKTSIAIISVEDTGVGIPSSVKETLLNDSNMTTEGTAGEKGTAFGLLVCKQYLQLNETSLYLDTAERKGCLFWFTALAKKVKITD